MRHVKKKKRRVESLKCYSLFGKIRASWDNISAKAGKIEEP